MATTLITGASSGIGEAFAQALAARGDTLILVARSEDKLNAIAQQLSTTHDCHIEVIVQDLVAAEGPSAVFQAVQDLGLSVDTLINNAGFGDYGAFCESDRLKQLDMIRLNTLALTDLTYQFLPGMVSRKSGCIMNIASIAAFQAMPYLAVYAATKAFVLSLSEALWAEVKSAGVKVMALCPGPTTTNFQATANFPEALGDASQITMTAEAVVAEALKAMEEDAPTVVNGGVLNQVIVNLSRFLPRPVMTKTIAQQFRPPSS